MPNPIAPLLDRLAPLRRFSDRWLSPFALLGARVMVAYAFFVSGWLKLGYVLNGQTETLYFLFEDYMVPFLPLKLAAWMGMMGEVGLSALLAVGLLGRFAALGLIVMAGVIYSVDQNALAPYWAIICAIVAAQGPGRLSLDALIFRRQNLAGKT